MMHFSKIQLSVLVLLSILTICGIPRVQGEEAVGSLKFSPAECVALGGSAACEKDTIGTPNCKNANQFVVGECLGNTNLYCCRTVTSTDSDGNPVTANNQSDAQNTFYSQWNNGDFPEKTANNGTLVAPGNLKSGQTSSSSCSTIGGVCVSGTCSSQNRVSANGVCSNTGESCCSSQIAPSCSGTCRTNSCNTNEAPNSSQMCSGGSYQVCCIIDPNATASINPKLNYTLLEKIPGVDSTNLNLAAYLSAVYKLAIWIVGLCALFMFLVGAFMYMLSAANTSKTGSAKSIMQDALIGLILALTSYLILYVINPDLVNLKLPSVSMPSGGSADTGTPPSTPPAGAPPTGSGSGCGGLSVSGISTSQCNDASQKLSDVLACMQQKYPSAKITSISDSQGFDKCKNSWGRPPCAHGQTSCHYGGGASQKSSDCNKSHAADFSVKNASGGMDLSIADSLKKAGSACGGRVNDETTGPHPHIHISDQTNCCSL